MAYITNEHVVKKALTIVVHVDEDLDAGKRKQIERHLLKIVGISGLMFDSFRPHLLLISYCPSQIEVYEIMRELESLNLHAQLIVGI